MQIKKEDIVGTYKRVALVLCDSCNKETIYFEGKGIDPWSPWQCPKCKSEDYRPIINFGKKYNCPECKFDNVIITEPHSIEHRDGERYVVYLNSNETTICNRCETEFGLITVVETENDLDHPENWKHFLHRKVDDHAETSGFEY